MNLAHSFYKVRVEPSIKTMELRSKSNLTSSRINQSSLTRENFFNKRSNQNLGLPSLSSYGTMTNSQRRNMSNSYRSQ